MRQRWGLIAVVAVISFFSGGWLLQRGAARDGGVFQQARLFDDVLSHISAYYVDSIPEGELYHRASTGLLAGIPIAEGRHVGARLSGYRWHLADPAGAQARHSAARRRSHDADGSGQFLAGLRAVLA